MRCVACEHKAVYRLYNFIIIALMVAMRVFVLAFFVMRIGVGLLERGTA